MTTETSTPTVATALMFLMENEDNIDHMKVAQDVVIKSPHLFFELVPEVSPTELMARLVKASPSIFMEFARRRSRIAMSGRTVIDFLIAGEKVQAIKVARDLYELGLRDAKDVIDNLIETLFTRGLVKTGYDAERLSDINKHVYDELMTFIPEQAQP